MIPNAPPPLLIRRPEDIPAAIVQLEQSGAIGIAELLRRAAAGRIALISITQGTPHAYFKRWAASTREQPAVALVGADDYRNTGPADWPLAERAVRWAAAVLLHAAGAEREHYIGAAEAAQTKRRVLIVECGTVTLPQWRGLVTAMRPMPAALVILPREGAAHPVLPARGAMQ